VREQFIASFANPPREPEVEFSPSVRGSLFLLNSELVQSWVNVGDNNSTTQLLKISDNTEIIDSLYFTLLSRPATAVEMKQMRDFLISQSDRPDAIAQLVWALLSSNEFLINH
jgi:hypothetical protein